MFPLSEGIGFLKTKVMFVNECVQVNLRLANTSLMKHHCSHFAGVLLKDKVGVGVTLTTLSAVGQVQSKLNFSNPVFQWFCLNSDSKCPDFWTLVRFEKKSSMI